MMTNIQTVIVTILYISVLGLFIESCIIFRNLKNQLHAYLLLSCIVILVNHLGYTLEQQATSMEAYKAALKFSYAGRVWIAFSLMMFAAEFCHIKIPINVKRILIFFHVIVYASILTIGQTNLYYKKLSFSLNRGIPVLRHQNGIMHHFFIQLQIIYIVAGMSWLFLSLKRQKSAASRKRHIIVISAFIIETVCYLLQISRILPISELFDITMIGNVILTVFMYLAIFKCNLLGIIDIARDYMIDRLSEGIVAVDNDGKVQYYNEPALKLFPELETDPQKVASDIEYAIIHENTITVNNRIYTPESNVLEGGGETLGVLYAMVDSTVLKLKEYKLKADAEILEMAARNMKDRLLTTEELMRQDRAMRHDRRHFEALLYSLLQDGKIDEARECLKERLSQEPRSSKRFCENTTVNAALTHYISLAERQKIKVNASTNIPFEPGVDEMKLAIAISNLLENAIHACEKVPESDRFIDITAKFKGQLLLEVSNSCEKKVELNEEGHPFSNEDGHGIGTKSIIAFVQETDSEIRYIAEDKVFKVRMVIN